MQNPLLSNPSDFLSSTSLLSITSFLACKGFFNTWNIIHLSGKNWQKARLIPSRYKWVVVAPAERLGGLRWKIIEGANFLTWGG